MPFTVGGERIPSPNKNQPKKKILIRKQQKNGKPVTTILNIELSESELKELVRFLKKECHCGGTSKQGVIELQGSLEEQVLKALKNYPARELNL